MPRDWLNLTSEEYHAAEGLSSSALRSFMFEGNLKFYHRYVLKSIPNQESPAKELGKAFHKAMEKPDTWEAGVFVMPDRVPDGPIVASVNKSLGKGATEAIPGEEWNGRLSSHQKIQKTLTAAALATGKSVMSGRDFSRVRDMVNAVWDNDACRKLLEGKGIRAEMSVFYQNDRLPFRVKALLDMSDPDSVIDFKATRFHHYSGFLRDAHRRGYQWQMGHYCFVSQRSQARIISVTNEPPFEANLYTLPKAQIDQLIDGPNGIKTQIGHIAQLWKDMAAGGPVALDSCGVPYGWHSDRWGSEIPFDLRIADGIEFE